MMKFLIAIITTIIIFMALFPHISRAKNTDIELNIIKFYGYFKGGARGSSLYLDDKEIAIKKGEQLRIEFSEYNQLDGTTPDIIDIEATVSNGSHKIITDIDATLTIYPKVAYFVYVEDYPEKIWDNEGTQLTAEWFTPIILMKKKINKLDIKSSTKVVFEKINLQKIIDKYLKKELWPIELKFEVSVEPQGAEDTFHNNTIFKILKIPLPIY